MIEVARIEVRVDDDVPVLVLIGEFDLAARDLLQEQLRTLQADGHRRIVLDLSRTQFVDSSAIGAVALAHRGGLDMTLRGATGVVYKALEVSGLTALLHVE
jgi:anti-anti-sigma factor